MNADYNTVKDQVETWVSNLPHNSIPRMPDTLVNQMEQMVSNEATVHLESMGVGTDTALLNVHKQVDGVQISIQVDAWFSADTIQHELVEYMEHYTEYDPDWDGPILPE